MKSMIIIQIDQNVRPKYAIMQRRTAVTYRVRCYGNMHTSTLSPNTVLVDPTRSILIRNGGSDTQ